MAEKDGRMAELEKSSAELQSHAEGLVRTVIILKHDLKPGEAISAANTETVEIEADVSQQYYLSPDNVGKVSACVDIPAGIPVYASQTAVPVQAPGSEESAASEERETETVADEESAAAGAEGEPNG